MADAADHELVEKARYDPAAFGVLFDRHYQAILGYVLRRTGNVEIARDITAQVFLNAFQHLWRFRWTGVSVAAWLYRIASNELIGTLRRKDSKNHSLDELREVMAFDTAVAQTLEEELLEAERELQRHRQFLDIQRALTRLSPKYQEVIALRYFEEKTIAEVAEIAGKPEGTVKSLISRGLDQLRRHHEKR